MNRAFLVIALLTAIPSFAGSVACSGILDGEPISLEMKFDDVSDLEATYISPDRDFFAFNVLNDRGEPVIIVEYAGLDNTANRIEILESIIRENGSNQFVKLENTVCAITRG